MQRKTIALIFFVTLAVFMTYDACSTRKPVEFAASDLSIELRWIPGLEVTTKRHAEIGLLWGFAQLGAFLPKDCDQTAMQWRERVLTVNLKGLGFEEHTYPVWDRILKELKASEEYLKTGAVDMGRFLMLSVGTANHYYELVRTPETLSEFRSQYQFNGKALKLTKSAIAHGDRMIYIADAKGIRDIAYIGAESDGDFADFKFEPTEFETIDILPNGQPRFGIYDANGRRKKWANQEMTEAGKPSKCMWCHESKVMSLVVPNSTYTDQESISEDEFLELVERQNTRLRAMRDSLDTELNYAKWREHQKMERIYEHFMEPSLKRLAMEWGQTEAEVASKLVGIATHRSRDFGEVYHRHEVEGLAPYKGARVPGAARESSAFEPSLF